MEPKVAVVILNWNGASLLARFLPALMQTQYANVEFVVGDNASTDDSEAFLKSNYPQVKIIKNDKNYGFAEGYNRILAQVEADYFVLLNSDVEVTPFWIEPVIKLMETDALIAAAQPKIKSVVSPKEFEYAGAAGGYLDRYAFPFCQGRIFDTLEQDLGQYQTAKQVFWASGAALFIKQSAWQNSGGLDPQLFAHMEEIDLCWRLKNKGLRIMYCPDSTVYHLGGATLANNHPHKLYLNFRNNLIIMQKNLAPAEVFGKIFLRMSIDFVAWIKFMLTAEFKFAFAINKAHWHFVKSLPRAKKSAFSGRYKDHEGVLNKSIVWAYFIKKKRRFSQLLFK